jgi:hypothetical protein
MRIMLTILLTVATMTVFGQAFEGKIIYQNTYQSNLPNVNNDQFTAMMGTRYEYLIKGGDYKSSSNGSMIQWQLYINKDNKFYLKMSNSETIFWNYGNINPDSILSVELNKGVTEILGYMCDEVIFTCKSGVQKYYFNQKIAVDISLFQNHLFGNWYDFLKVSKSHPLKSIVETPQFTITSEAIAIEEMNLDAKVFQLPENAKTAKSPY